MNPNVKRPMTNLSSVLGSARNTRPLGRFAPPGKVPAGRPDHRRELPCTPDGTPVVSVSTVGLAAEESTKLDPLHNGPHGQLLARRQMPVERGSADPQRGSDLPHRMLTRRAFPSPAASFSALTDGTCLPRMHGAGRGDHEPAPPGDFRTLVQGQAALAPYR
jgi:hypothetical protein